MIKLDTIQIDEFITSEVLMW